MTDGEFLALKEAAEFLDVSRTTVWSMVREGRIKAYTKPTDKRVKLFRKADLEALKYPQPIEGERGKHEVAS